MSALPGFPVHTISIVITIHIYVQSRSPPSQSEPPSTNTEPAPPTGRPAIKKERALFVFRLASRRIESNRIVFFSTRTNKQTASTFIASVLPIKSRSLCSVPFRSVPFLSVSPPRPPPPRNTHTNSCNVNVPARRFIFFRFGSVRLLYCCAVLCRNRTPTKGSSTMSSASSSSACPTPPRGTSFRTSRTPTGARRRPRAARLEEASTTAGLPRRCSPPSRRPRLWRNRARCLHRFRVLFNGPCCCIAAVVVVVMVVTSCCRRLVVVGGGARLFLFDDGDCGGFCRYRCQC